MPYLCLALNVLSGVLKIILVIFGAICLTGALAGLILHLKRR